MIDENAVPMPTMLATVVPKVNDSGIVESWLCVDCGINTAPGFPSGDVIRDSLARDGKVKITFDCNSEIYTTAYGKRRGWRHTAAVSASDAWRND
jgi:hypothetical protein